MSVHTSNAANNKMATASKASASKTTFCYVPVIGLTTCPGLVTHVFAHLNARAVRYQSSNALPIARTALTAKSCDEFVQPWQNAVGPRGYRKPIVISKHMYDKLVFGVKQDPTDQVCGEMCVCLWNHLLTISPAEHDALQALHSSTNVINLLHAQVFRYPGTTELFDTVPYARTELGIRGHHRNQEEVVECIPNVVTDRGSLCFVHKVRSGGRFGGANYSMGVRKTEFHLETYAKNRILTTQTLMVMLTEDTAEEHPDEYMFPLGNPNNQDVWFDSPGGSFVTQNDVMLWLSRNVVYLTCKRHELYPTELNLIVDDRTRRGLAKIDMFLRQTCPDFANAKSSIQAVVSSIHPFLITDVATLVLAYCGLDGSCNNWTHERLVQNVS